MLRLQCLWRMYRLQTYSHNFFLLIHHTVFCCHFRNLWWTMWRFLPRWGPVSTSRTIWQHSLSGSHVSIHCGIFNYIYIFFLNEYFIQQECNKLDKSDSKDYNTFLFLINASRNKCITVHFCNINNFNTKCSSISTKFLFFFFLRWICPWAACKNKANCVWSLCMSLIFLLKWQFLARISFNERRLTFWHSFRVINAWSFINILRQGQKLQMKHQKN